MSIRNSVASVVAVLLMSASLPACGQSAPPAAQGNEQLSPEQKAMMFMDARDKLQSMPADQRRAYREQLHQQYESMTSAQKDQKRQQLDAEWQALPQAKKDKIEARIQNGGAKHDKSANDGSDEGH